MSATQWSCPDCGHDGRYCNGPRWSSAETQFCAACGVYHFRDACTDPYFNNPELWKD